jgi:replicative DNA helicase
MKLIKRNKQETITIKELFDKYQIPNTPNIEVIPDIHVKVLTPYGYKSITSLFRTEIQQKVTCYFGNNKTLQCSSHHLLKTQDGWTKVLNIKPSDIIETELGMTYLKELKYLDKYESLYDITVDEVNCYYSNGILSHNSTSMINVGAHLLRQGKTVVHYTMELSEPYVAQRYDSVVTGIATANLKYNLEEVEHELSKLKGQLYLKFFPTKTASVTTLKAHLDKMIMQGVKPDIVIVDYADLLRSAKAKEKLHEELETTYEDLRGLAGEYQIPVVTASQANRSSVESDIITSDQVASSFSKIMIGDVIISLARKTTDKIAGTGRVHFIKNRFGPDGLTLPTKLNMSNGRIDMYQESSVKGRETKTEMDEDSVTRKSLATKYSELLGNSLG